ncbi:hypothetical protein LINPERHAP1_LOCUS23932, partial [Linum perenne]
MATVCFERAGDEHGEKLAKAAGLVASADNIQSSNPEEASIARRQAADIFESIGRTEHAAECFYVLKDYEKAGKLYLLCGESTKVKAAECFCLAGSFKLAADLYIDESHFSKCLSACTEGKLFKEGFHYIQQWKQTAVKWSTELEKLEHEFLQFAAVHCHKLNDRMAMVRYVKAFESLESMRTFLRSVGYLEELLLLEEEYGNFLEAANIAKLKGDFILEADLLGKAKYYVDASSLILIYVLAKSLWLTGTRGWPLKQFKQKKSLLEKAKYLAKYESEQYFNFVSVQVKILLNEETSFLLLQQHLADSRRQKSISDELSPNNASVDTLVHYWILWRDHILGMLKYLEDAASKESVDLTGYGEICCDYFGVRRCVHNGNPIYICLNSDASWIKEMDSRFLLREGELTCIDVKQLFSIASRHWSSELIFVGISVLRKLKELYYSVSLKSSSSSFQEMKSLIHIYVVARFLLDLKFSKFLGHKSSEMNEYINLFVNFFEGLFPLDWRESVNAKMVSFRRTDLCRNLLKDFVIRHSSFQDRLSYGQLGRIAVSILGSAVKTFHGSGFTMAQIRDSSWKSLIDYLLSNDAEIPNGLECALHKALLMENYIVTGQEFISPSCFLYLVERQLILVSSINGYFITTKSSFIEWLIYQEGRNDSQSTSSKSRAPEIVPDILKFIAHVIEDFLRHEKKLMQWMAQTEEDCRKNTMQWAGKSDGNVRENYGTVVLGVVLIVCTLYFNFGLGHELICDILSWRHVTKILPKGIHHTLLWIGKNHPRGNLNMHAESFNVIGNPLVVACLDRKYPYNLCPSAVFVDMTSRSIDDVYALFFDRKEAVKVREESDSNVGSSIAQLWDTFEMLLSSGNQVQEENSNVQIDSSTKIEIEKAIHFLSNRMDQNQNPPDEKSRKLLAEAASTLDELKQLHSMVADVSGLNSSIIG